MCVNESFIVSYNMHGFNQGIDLVKDLVNSSHSPSLVLLQEHWLTPANMHVFDDNITTHYAFGKSAMSAQVTRGSRPNKSSANQTMLTTE